MKRRPIELKPQFSSSEIGERVRAYGPDQDDEALVAGAKIARGDYRRENLEAIFRWKTKGRGVSRLKVNSDEEIADALHLAVNAKTERSAITAPCGLFGVEVPVASAILTTINPERFTVIDFRALEALGTETKDRTVDFYLYYLAACRDWARRYDVTLRNLDRALWQWSSAKSNQKI
jgi:hypothetical protein